MSKDVWVRGAVQHVYTDGPYAEALNRELAKHDGNIYDHDGCDGNERYLLIESSRYDGEVCMATYASPEDAAFAHDSQEDPTDWPIKALVDLEAETELTAETTTTFKPKENG